jgi:hypothetical protein
MAAIDDAVLSRAHASADERAAPAARARAVQAGRAVARVQAHGSG